jgi:hypothetical protein
MGSNIVIWDYGIIWDYLMAGAAFFEFPVKLELENKLESGPRLRVKARSYEQIIAI